MRTIFTKQSPLNQSLSDIGEKVSEPSKDNSDEESPIVKSLASHFAHYRPELLTQDKTNVR